MIFTKNDDSAYSPSDVASSSKKLPPAPLPTEQPPPYYTGPLAPRALLEPGPSASRAPPPPMTQAANRLCIKTKKEPIAGIFNIDPALASPTLEKKRRRGCGRRKHSRDEPHARFETRHGAVSLGLAVVNAASSPPMQMRANVDVQTRHGHADVAVHGVAPGRNLNLRVETRGGDVFVLLPRSFRGPVLLRSRHGALKVLPAAAGITRTVSARDDELVALFGDVALPPNTNLAAGAAAWSGDCASLESRHGNVVLGVVDEDVKPETGGFWKKLGELIAGRYN